MILKAMNVGEILDKSFKMFKEQLKSYLGIAAVGGATVVGLGLLVLLVYYVIGEIAALIVGGIAFIFLTVVYLAMIGGLIKKASEQTLGRDISIREAYQFGFRKAWHLLLGSLLISLVVMLGFILLIIPGIYFSIRFSLFFQYIIIEGLGPWSALKRSKVLTKGSWWRSFGIITLITVLASIITNIITFPITLLSTWLLGQSFIGQIAQNMLTLPISFLITPFSMIAFTLLYYDLRIRKENLDLKIMVDGLTENNTELPRE